MAKIKLDVQIEGITCATCFTRVAKSLNEERE